MKTSRIVLLVFTVVLLLSVSLIFAACDREETCTHQWGEFQTTCEPTCHLAGLKIRTCALCGATESEEIPAGEHSYVGIMIPSTCTQAGYTMHICICGSTYVDNEVAIAEHPYVDTVVQPTCTQRGYTTHTCSVCGYHYDDTYVTPLAHDYVAGAVTSPTCTEQGYTLYECADCDATEKRDYTNALGHDMGDWQDDGSCTCGRTGCNTVVSATSGLEYVEQTDGTYYVAGLRDDCTATEIIIPGKFNGKVVSGIKERAFFGNIAITSVDIPASVEYIGQDAFFACTSLATLHVNSTNTKYEAVENSLIEKETHTLILARGNTIPDSVTAIAAHAFAYSTVESIEIPAGVTTVAQKAFYRTSRLMAITVAAGNETFSAAGNCLIETATKTLVLGCKGSVIPTDGSVEIIGSYAFAYIRTLTELSIPSSVAAIRPNAFVGCIMLLEEMNGGFYVDNWLVDCDNGASSLVVKPTISGFADDSLDGCSSLTFIYYPSYVDDWKNKVHRFEGWSTGITIVCEDAQIVAGVEKAGDDTVSDPF